MKTAQTTTSLEVIDNATGKTTAIVQGINPDLGPSDSQFVWRSVDSLRFGYLHPQPNPPGVQR